jgi:predicted ATP-binding protein involved in virulence
MRLAEFRIKNFRSIIDSGWNTLSADNITALIGQNESGKTSVLEALYSFWEGTISEDVLRSDMTIPEVSCSYFFGEDEPFEQLDAGRLPAEVLSSVKKSGFLKLTRKWMPDLSSQVMISGARIPEIFDKIEKDEVSLTETTREKSEKVLEETGLLLDDIYRLEKNTLYLENEINRTSKKHAKLSKLLKRCSDPEKHSMIKQETEEAEREYNDILSRIKAEEMQLIEKRDKLAEMHVLRKQGEKCLKLLAEFENIKPETEKAYRELADIEDNLALLNGEREMKAGELKLYETKEKYITARQKMEYLREMAGTNIRIMNHLAGGMDMVEAEKEAEKEYSAYSNLFTREETGEAFFNCIPRHEFFEDFSSLLPNRIDLDDIFENNARIEGYKAVRNFLVIAGLDPKFFKQTNNRILKQKIENLNNEVTIDFQEYWRQNIGKDNKIKIHFELEHYDISHPEKKGKPYLEFWIKDEHERLYPKQRSRGVRWFLSFYLELKAFAKENNNTRRILLIDEPGLSLHARAQEDVLKVFEDIKDQVQIIYTTHSPHLIDHNKLFRLLAVQRSGQNGEQSETLIYDATHLQSATSDTLSPVSSLLGSGFDRRHFNRQTRNVIVEDICSFYYLKSLCRMHGGDQGINFLPAHGPAGITIIVNLLIGWGFDFAVLVFDTPDNHDIISELKSQLEGFKQVDPVSRVIMLQNFEAPEDLFSTLDFKKHIIKKRIGIAGSNSGYLRDNDVSRPLLASGFAQAVEADELSTGSFDEETRLNLEELFNSVTDTLRISGETV